MFLARDSRLRRDVALKSLHPTLAHKPRFATQLLREARAVARLNHPNVAQVFDVLDVHGRTLIVMEYLEGETLAQRIRRRGPDSPLETVSLGTQMASALAHAHSHGILHCDLKPGNVFVTRDGVVKVLDFGLARVIDAEAGVSDPGLGATPTMLEMRAGTPAYMSPEQLDGRLVTERSDIYSLGVVLYELSCGRRPTGVGKIQDPLESTRTSIGLSPDQDLPESLRRVIAKSLASSPEQRYRSATDLRAALESTAATLTTQPRQTSHTIALFLGLALCVVVVAGLLVAENYPLFHRAAVGAANHLPVVAIAPFESPDESSDSRLLAMGLTELVTDNLSTSSGVVTVSTAAVRAASGDRAKPERVAHDLGAAFVISGRFEPSGDRTRVTLSVFDSRNGRTTQAAVFEASAQEIVADSPALAARVRSLIVQAGVPIGDSSSSGQYQPASRAALEDYVAGRDLLEHQNVPGNLDQSIQMLTSSTERDPAFALAHAALGEALWRKYRRTRDRTWATKAQAAAFDALRLGPDQARVRLTAAIVLRGTGESDKAIGELRHALQLQPNYPEAHRLLGTVLAETGSLEEGLREFRRALELQPIAPDTQHALGLAYYDAGRFTDAIAAFTEETRIRPQSASAYQLMGASYQSLGRNEEALESYRQATAIAPSAQSYANIGMIRYGQRKFDDAVAAYRSAIAIDANIPETHRNLGDSLSRAGDPDGAAQEYRKAIGLADRQLEVNPKDGKLVALTAVCYAKLHRGSDARAALSSATKISPDDSEVHYLAGVASALVGDSIKSIDLLQRALNLGYSLAVLQADDDLATLRSLKAYSTLHASSSGR